MESERVYSICSIQFDSTHAVEARACLSGDLSGPSHSFSLGLDGTFSGSIGISLRPGGTVLGSIGMDVRKRLKIWTRPTILPASKAAQQPDRRQHDMHTHQAAPHLINSRRAAGTLGRHDPRTAQRMVRQGQDEELLEYPKANTEVSDRRSQCKSRPVAFGVWELNTAMLVEGGV